MKVPNQQQLVLGPHIEQVWAEGHHPVQNKGRNSSQRLSTVLAIAARVAWNGPAWRTQRIQRINYENNAYNAHIHLLSIVISSKFTRLHEWGVQVLNIWTSGGGNTGRSASASAGPERGAEGASPPSFSAAAEAPSASAAREPPPPGAAAAAAAGAAKAAAEAASPVSSAAAKESSSL